jgi:flagellar basal body rod protein FlgG
MKLKLKYSGCVTILAVAACMGTSAGQPAYAQNKAGFDAYDSTWNMDIAKTDFGNMPAPKSVRLTLSGTKTSRKWTQVTVGADGKSQTRSYHGAADNRYYPINGDPDAATFAYLKDGSFAIKDKSGKVVQTTTYSLSADGATMTLHSTYHSPRRDETHVAVFQKER